MGVNFCDRDRQCAVTSGLKVPDDFASDDRAMVAADVDFAGAAIFVILMKCSVFSVR